MPAPVIRIELQADGPLVEAPSYRDAFDALLGLLRELDRAFTLQAGGAGQSTRWFIQRTATSDPTIDLLAEPSTSDIGTLWIGQSQRHSTLWTSYRIVLAIRHS